MPLHRFDRAQLPETPWKNGGGVTREIACWPPGAGLADFEARVSIARIAADGPFSAFAGVDRQILLLDGGGLRLSSPDGAVEHRLDTPLAPFAFAGEAAVEARLLAGASSDFNLMTRRAALRAELLVLRAPTELPPCAQGLLFAAQGDWQLGTSEPGSAPEFLPCGQGLWWHAGGPRWRLEPATADAAMIAVQLWPASSPSS